MLMYKFFSLRIVVVILDVKKYNIVIVDILLNESVKDFFVQIYCVGSDSKIVVYFIKVLGNVIYRLNVLVVDNNFKK